MHRWRLSLFIPYYCIQCTQANLDAFFRQSLDLTHAETSSAFNIRHFIFSKVRNCYNRKIKQSVSRKLLVNRNLKGTFVSVERYSRKNQSLKPSKDQCHTNSVRNEKTRNLSVKSPSRRPIFGCWLIILYRN